MLSDVSGSICRFVSHESLCGCGNAPLGQCLNEMVSGEGIEPSLSG